MDLNKVEMFQKESKNSEKHYQMRANIPLSLKLGISEFRKRLFEDNENKEFDPISYSEAIRRLLTDGLKTNGMKVT